jgi:hypothetical protein
LKALNSIFTSLSLALSLVTFSSCLKEKAVNKVSRSPGSSNPISPDTPVRWGTSALSSGLDLKIHSDFSADVSEIEQQMTDWNNSTSSFTFFRVTANTASKTISNDLNSYNDSELGIYKKQAPWFSNVSNQALAITQYFGIQRNGFIEIIHADIIVNEDNFNFSNDANDNANYHLPSVILHELGHFIGLPHESDFSIQSVMSPFLGSTDSFSGIFSRDVSAARSLYSVSSLSTLSMISPNPDYGQPVHGIIELRSNGNCVHKVDNKVVHTHY